MSGQSLGVSGPEIGQVKGQISSRAGPSYSAPDIYSQIIAKVGCSASLP